ncbi:hypothetical protein M0R45_021704 [Rubus argutus]|uniref:Uncharacterized protein n=1 Tax=Rubus argutus TaxID=59490 RepID=A0AAW1XDG1_RUBAR
MVTMVIWWPAVRSFGQRFMVFSLGLQGINGSGLIWSRGAAGRIAWFWICGGGQRDWRSMAGPRPWILGLGGLPSGIGLNYWFVGGWADLREFSQGWRVREVVVGIVENGS